MGDIADGVIANSHLRHIACYVSPTSTDDKGADMKVRALLVGVLLAVSVVGAASPAQACGEGQACALINRICETVAGPCIP